MPKKIGKVTPPRLERGTGCLEGSCSIQLSYGAGEIYEGEIVNQEKSRGGQTPRLRDAVGQGTDDPLLPKQMLPH